jgi:predicted nucleotidyltransferase component of viral defense system
VPDHGVTLTEGHILRHAPASGGLGREAALIDIAQDLLLRHLHDTGVLELFAFKGGTALRKLYAGAAGRFSTDLDFSVASSDDDPPSALSLLAEAIHGAVIGPFTYRVVWRNDKPTIEYHSSFGRTGTTLASKLDVGPPPWLALTRRCWVTVPIHNRYGGALPQLPVMDLGENIAEKVARLNRVSPPRDAYDLWWVSTTPGLHLDQRLVRRLAVLKCWVDLNGLHHGAVSWPTLPSASGFDPTRWTTPRRARDFDDDSIGLLTAPPPNLDDLGRQLAERYRWLVDLDSDERRVAAGNAADRGLVLRMLALLPGCRLTGCR